jgi:hypothetical protein
MCSLVKKCDAVKKKIVCGGVFGSFAPWILRVFVNFFFIEKIRIFL